MEAMTITSMMPGMPGMATMMPGMGTKMPGMGTMMPGMGTMMPGMGTMMPMSGPHRKMWMWFHTELNDTALFKSWWITDAGTMVWSCAVIIVFCILLEALRWGRWVLQSKTNEPNSRLSHMFSAAHLIDTALFILQTALSYTLMLFFMTFSVWIGTSLCLGLAIGYYFFGTRKIKQ